MAHVDKRKVKSGWRYEVRYRAPDGSERSKSFRTRREANDFLTTVTNDLMRNGWIDPRRRRTFEEWAREWLKADPNKRPKTLACDESTIELHRMSLPHASCGRLSGSCRRAPRAGMR